MVEQERARIRVELLLGEQVLGEDAVNEFPGAMLVLDLCKLPRRQPLDHGLGHPPRNLVSGRHDPKRREYTAARGESSGTIWKISQKLRSARREKDPKPRSFPRQALDVDGTPMRLDERLNQVQP